MPSKRPAKKPAKKPTKVILSAKQTDIPFHTFDVPITFTGGDNVQRFVDLTDPAIIDDPRAAFLAIYAICMRLAGETSKLRDRVNENVRQINLLQQELHGDFSDSPGLSDGGQWRRAGQGKAVVIEADHGDIFRDPLTSV